MKKSHSTCVPSESVFTLFLLCLPGILFFLLLPGSSHAYYVGPEVGKAQGETKIVKPRGAFGSVNATSLAEAAYVPYINGVGNGVIEFLKSFIPSLQPKVDFFAEQIQDTIDTANTKLMQKLENGNNGIIAIENFFTGLMKAFVFGKGPEEEERRKRLAMALIKSGMLKNISFNSGTTTALPTEATIEKTTVASSTSMTTVPYQEVSSSSITTITVPISSGANEEEDVENNSIPLPTDPTSTSTTTARSSTTTFPSSTTTSTTSSTHHPPPVQMRDNDFTKIKVMQIVNNML